MSTNQTISVRPAAGVIVVDPITFRALPEGEVTVVPASGYWLRRVADGEVVEEPAGSPNLEA